PLRAPDRATTPLWRDPRGRLRPIDWPTATKRFVDRFRSILQTHGPESVAFLSTGQMPNEEMAFLGALAKFGMGMIHGDGNTRQCMATSVVAYREALGFDAPPHTDPSPVSNETGLSIDAIEPFASSVSNGERVSFWWTMGVNQSHQGTRTAQAIISLALMTGNIGRRGTGANSITGQCNAMGSRL